MRRWLEQAHEVCRRSCVPQPNRGEIEGDEESAVAFAVGVMQLAAPSLAAHCRRVAEVSKTFAARLGMNAASQTLLFRAGLLHDLGRLTMGAHWCPEADTEVPAHSVEGASLISVLPAFSRVVPWVHAHHENFDGTGFPDGLSGTGIPLGARLLRIVDDFDNAACGRGLPAADGQQALAEGAGTVYDPFLVKKFIEFRAAQGSEPPAGLPKK